MAISFALLTYLVTIIMPVNAGLVRPNDVNNNGAAEAFQLVPGAHPSWGVMKAAAFSTAASVVTITAQDQYASQFAGPIDAGLLPPSAPLSSHTSTLTHTVAGAVIIVPTSLFYPTYIHTAVSITSSATTVVGAIYDDHHTIVDGQPYDEYVSNHPGAHLTFSPGVESDSSITITMLTTMLIPVEATEAAQPSSQVRSRKATTVETRGRTTTTYKTHTRPSKSSNASPSRPVGNQIEELDAQLAADADTLGDLEEGVTPAAAEEVPAENQVPLQAPAEQFDEVVVLAAA